MDSGGNMQSNEERNAEKQMDNYLKGIGFHRKKIAKDGSCLFRAVAEQVKWGKAVKCFVGSCSPVSLLRSGEVCLLCCCAIATSPSLNLTFPNGQSRRINLTRLCVVSYPQILYLNIKYNTSVFVLK